MSAEYKNIPPERELAFLNNAEAAVNEASEKTIHYLGRLLVGEAIHITKTGGVTLEDFFSASDEIEPLPYDLNGNLIPLPAREPMDADSEEAHNIFMTEAYAATAVNRKELKHLKLSPNTAPAPQRAPETVAYQPPAPQPGSLN